MRPEHWLYTIPLRLRSLFRWAQPDQESQYREDPAVQTFLKDLSKVGSQFEDVLKDWNASLRFPILRPNFPRMPRTASSHQTQTLRLVRREYPVPKSGAPRNRRMVGFALSVRDAWGSVILDGLSANSEIGTLRLQSLDGGRRSPSPVHQHSKGHRLRAQLIACQELH
jgi:hypothetical protein